MFGGGHVMYKHKVGCQKEVKLYFSTNEHLKNMKGISSQLHFLLIIPRISNMTMQDCDRLKYVDNLPLQKYSGMANKANSLHCIFMISLSYIIFPNFSFSFINEPLCVRDDFLMFGHYNGGSKVLVNII